MSAYPRHPRVNTFGPLDLSARTAVLLAFVAGGCIEMVVFDDLDPDCGLAFGRAVGVGVDGRLTGVFSPFSFSLLAGACPGGEEEAML